MAAAAARAEAVEEGREPPPMPPAAVVKKVRLEEPLLPAVQSFPSFRSSRSSWSSLGFKGPGAPRGLRLSWPSSLSPGLPARLKGSGGGSSSIASSSCPRRNSGGEGSGGGSSSIASSSCPRGNSGREEAKRAVGRLSGWIAGHNPVSSSRARQLLNRLQAKRESDSGIRRLDSKLVRDAFHDKRLQVLTGDRHNLDVIGPYARLHLHIKEARHLLALDSNGASDPYVEVFVNDFQKGRSVYVPKTLEPTWDFGLTVDIWSPFTIVRIAVMDWDRFTKDDYIGFVEFRVAEVEPNGPWCSGWCELRQKEMLEGTATHRFRHHRMMRDDHEYFRSGRSHLGDGGTPDPILINRYTSFDTNFSFTQGQSQDSRPSVSEYSRVSDTTLDTDMSVPASDPGRRRSHLRRMKAAFCCANDSSREAASEDDVNEPQRDTNGKRLNAGEVHLSMRLETVAEPPDKKNAKRHPSLGCILLSSVICPSRLLDICQDEEWFACCFPHPQFEKMASEAKDAFCLQDIKEFFQEAVELKAMLQNCIAWPLLSIFLYIVCWRDLALSSLTMAYWLAICMWPFHLMPTMPLWCAYWLHLFRDRSRSNAFFAHEATAPLTEEGFAMVAALHSSKRMAVWLRRVVKDRGGWVDKLALLHSYASLTHKDGRPTLSFDHLVEDLMARPWVRNKVSREKHCKEGHSLEFLGMGIYQPGEGWCCSGPVDNTASPCEAGICEDGLHLGVRRYRCPSCCRDFCGLCAVGGRASGQLMKVNPAKLPMGGSAMVRTVRDFVLENQDAVDDLQELLEGFLKVVERLLNPQDLDLAFSVYVGLGALSAVLLGAVLLVHRELGFILQWSFTLFWMAVGSAFMVHGAMPIRRLRTAYRASRDYAKCRDLRLQGGCERWQFFTPD